MFFCAQVRTWEGFMRRFALGGAVSILLIHAGLMQCAEAQQAGEVPQSTLSSLPSYPKSRDGLKKFVEDIFGAVKSGDSEKASEYFSSLAIPNHDTWFVKVFGSEEGARLDSKYQELLAQTPPRISKSIEYALKGGRTNVEVEVVQKPVETSARLTRAAIEAMVEPTTIYVVDGTNPTEKYPTFIGEFVYLEGGFRYLDTEVIQALSTAPTPRIRVGGNVQLASLIHKVEPKYPDEAKASRTFGSVLLHIIVATDGTLKEVMLQSGDPVLGMAAVEAVRQWRYKPTLLNGEPVEVDTTVLVKFLP
jgi:TonB family protein